jgi:hypothetical protein
MIFDPGVEHAEQARGKDRQRGEADPQRLRPGGKRNKRERHGGEVRVALPPAQLARVQAEAILRDVRAGEQQRGHAEREPLRLPERGFTDAALSWASDSPRRCGEARAARNELKSLIPGS